VSDLPLGRCRPTALAAFALIALIVAPRFAAAGPTPSVGDRAPEFEFQGSDGELYTLKGQLAGGKHGIVLAFFPKAFTPG
jgi:hypothetical protein